MRASLIPAFLACACGFAAVDAVPADMDRIFADSFGALCGNDAVEVPETCDGNCPVCTESYTGYTSSGSAQTCDVVCHIPIQTCQGGDGVCPLVAGTGDAQCNAQTDTECLGTEWKYVNFQSVDTTSQSCVTVNIYGIQPGASYDLTTCAPSSGLAGSGDTVITSVTDNLGATYPVGNDDCADPTALPLLAGWTCDNAHGFAHMSCASPSPGGFIAASNVYRLGVSVCRFGSDGGIAPLYIWYNAATIPNPG
jgi:hypothetical protein